MISCFNQNPLPALQILNVALNALHLKAFRVVPQFFKFFGNAPQLELEYLPVALHLPRFKPQQILSHVAPKTNKKRLG